MLNLPSYIRNKMGVKYIQDITEALELVLITEEE